MRVPYGRVQRAGSQKFLLRARRFDGSVVDDSDLVDVHDGGEPVGNDNGRFASHELRYVLLNDGFVFQDGVGRRFIQNDDRCMPPTRANTRNSAEKIPTVSPFLQMIGT